MAKKTPEKKFKLKDLVVSEVSLVDRGANPHADVMLFKSDTPPEASKLLETAEAIVKGDVAEIMELSEQVFVAHLHDLAKDAQTFNEALEAEVKEEKAEEIMSQIYRLIWSLRRTLRSIIEDDEAPDKPGLIQQSLSQFQTAIAALMPALAEVLKKEDPTQEGEDTPTAKGDPMDPTVETLQEDLKKAEARATRAEAIALLTDEQKKHFNGLDEEGQAAFLKASPEVRATQVKKAVDDDEVIEVDGRTIRKSAVGEDQFALFQSLSKKSEDAERIAKEEQAKRETAEFTKKAEEEYANLPGEPIAKGKVLKAVADLSKEDREALEAMLKSGEEAAAELSKERGHSLLPDGDGPEERLEALVKEHASKNSVSIDKAYDAVLDTPEGKALYQESEEQKRSE